MHFLKVSLKLRNLSIPSVVAKERKREGEWGGNNDIDWPINSPNPRAINRDWWIKEVSINAMLVCTCARMHELIHTQTHLGTGTLTY